MSARDSQPGPPAEGSDPFALPDAGAVVPSEAGVAATRTPAAPDGVAEDGSDLGLPAPSTDADTVSLLAAALRADSSDLAVYERILFASLSEGLPAGVVDVERARSMSDRVAGRPGRATAIRVHLGEETLEIAEGRGAPVARITREVRGITISRREVTITEWTGRLAELLAQVAKDNATTRDALARLLGTT